MSRSSFACTSSLASFKAAEWLRRTVAHCTESGTESGKLPCLLSLLFAEPQPTSMARHTRIHLTLWCRSSDTLYWAVKHRSTASFAFSSLHAACRLRRAVCGAYVISGGTGSQMLPTRLLLWCNWICQGRPTNVHLDRSVGLVVASIIMSYQDP